MTAIHTPPADSNGSAEPVDFGDLRTLAGRLDRELASQAASLRGMLEAERALRAQVEEVLGTITAREGRLRRALAALEGTTPGPGRPKKQAAQTAQTSRRAGQASWVVGEDKVQRVRVALGELGEARVPELTRQTGLSTETARRAVRQLREREQARVVKRHKGRGDTFALMPGIEGGEPNAA